MNCDARKNVMPYKNKLRSTRPFGALNEKKKFCEIQIILFSLIFILLKKSKPATMWSRRRKMNLWTTETSQPTRRAGEGWEGYRRSRKPRVNPTYPPLRVVSWASSQDWNESQHGTRYQFFMHISQNVLCRLQNKDFALFQFLLIEIQCFIQF